MNSLSKLCKKSLQQGLGLAYKYSPFFKNIKKNGVTIFVFHDVTDNPSEFSRECGISVTIKTFIQQVDWIQSNFEIIHPSLLSGNNELPPNAAIISFDDGFLGSFENGLRILKEKKIPSLFFINMSAILEKKPIIPAIADYLNDYAPEFKDYCHSIGLSAPFHLVLTPSILSSFEKKYGKIDYDAILKYQGEFADIETVKKWGDKKYVVYGNHLYEHWNVPALKPDELVNEYQKNERKLSEHFVNTINFFAFTNGFPGHVNLLFDLGADVIFSSNGGANETINSHLLDRVGLYERDKNDAMLWYNILRACFQKNAFRNRLNATS